LNKNILIVTIFAFSAILLAAPISSFAATNNYSLTLSRGVCAAPTPIINKVETIGCTVPSTGPNSITPTTNDKTVHAVLYVFTGPSGSGHGSVACRTVLTIVHCNSFSFPTTSNGAYTVVLVFGGITSITLKMIAVVSILVTPEFPLGALIAVVAPLAGLVGYFGIKRFNILATKVY